jgi:ABC-2 type transport system ATP-binding protein
MAVMSEPMIILDLAAVADRKVSSLSGGQRRRLDIAMGLIHAPELLFLDEPSTGLDPQNRAIADDTPDRLKAVHAFDRMRLGFADEQDARAAATRVAAGHPDARVHAHGALVDVEMTGATAAVPGLRADLQAGGAPARSAEVVRPTLDDVFLRLTGRSLREGGAGSTVPRAHPVEQQEVLA